MESVAARIEASNLLPRLHLTQADGTFRLAFTFCNSNGERRYLCWRKSTVDTTSRQSAVARELTDASPARCDVSVFDFSQAPLGLANTVFQHERHTTEEYVDHNPDVAHRQPKVHEPPTLTWWQTIWSLLLNGPQPRSSQNRPRSVERHRNCPRERHDQPRHLAGLPQVDQKVLCYRSRCVAVMGT